MACCHRHSCQARRHAARLWRGEARSLPKTPAAVLLAGNTSEGADFEAVTISTSTAICKISDRKFSVSYYEIKGRSRLPLLQNEKLRLSCISHAMGPRHTTFRCSTSQRTVHILVYLSPPVDTLSSELWRSRCLVRTGGDTTAIIPGPQQRHLVVDESSPANRIRLPSWTTAQTREHAQIVVCREAWPARVVQPACMALAVRGSPRCAYSTEACWTLGRGSRPAHRVSSILDRVRLPAPQRSVWICSVECPPVMEGDIP